jgi:signal transduction histidine kinase
MVEAPVALPDALSTPLQRARRLARDWIARLASTPLLKKLIVADVVINALALIVVRSAPTESSTLIMLAALLATLLLNAALVYWALLPLRELERTAQRVSAGDLGLRFRVPFLADRNIARIGTTLNALLDGLTADRSRVRHLAAQVISAGDHERAHIARELHDSTAQSLSALEMVIAAAERDVPDGPMRERLRIMGSIASEALQEVRTLSHNVHPRVLDELGLVAAVEHLVRRAREQSGLPVYVTSDERVPVPSAIASVLYRVAQAALNNAVRHAQARQIQVLVTSDAVAFRLEVRDDGIGFDVRAVESARRGLGLFIMRERLGLLDGALTITSAPGAGTRICATVPAARSAA